MKNDVKSANYTAVSGFRGELPGDASTTATRMVRHEQLDGVACEGINIGRPNDKVLPVAARRAYLEYSRGIWLPHGHSTNPVFTLTAKRYCPESPYKSTTRI
jgi:hypothetical protein